MFAWHVLYGLHKTLMTFVHIITFKFPLILKIQFNLQIVAFFCYFCHYYLIANGVKFDKNRWYIIFSWYCHWSPDYYLSISLVGNNFIESGMDYKWIWSAWNGSVHTRLKKTVDSSNGDDKRSSCLSNAFLFIAEKKTLVLVCQFCSRCCVFDVHCCLIIGVHFYIFMCSKICGLNLWIVSKPYFVLVIVSVRLVLVLFFLRPAFFFLFHQ